MTNSSAKLLFTSSVKLENLPDLSFVESSQYGVSVLAWVNLRDSEWETKRFDLNGGLETPWQLHKPLPRFDQLRFKLFGKIVIYDEFTGALLLKTTAPPGFKRSAWPTTGYEKAYGQFYLKNSDGQILNITTGKVTSSDHIFFGKE